MSKKIENKQVLRLVSPIPESVNHYLGYKVVTANGRHMAVSYLTKKARDFKTYFIQYAQQQMKEQHFAPSTNKYQFVHYDVTPYFPRIDMDNNNYYKQILDALTDAGVWVNDNIVIEKCNRIYYDSANPRLEIEIYYADYIGIFDNQKHLNEFLKQCKKCSKYKNGKCSRLNNAKIGRIQDDIVDFVCTKFTHQKA